MLTLAFDTSSNALSVCLLSNQEILDKYTIFQNGRQAELLVLEIEKILEKNNIWYQDLDLITTISGPGSFTGIRIGLSVARIIKIATNKPLLLLNSLEAIAYKYKKHQGKIIAIIDAKMDEFFAAEFLCQDEILTTIREPQLISAGELENFLPKDDFLICGSAKNPTDLLEADDIGLLAFEKFQNQNLSSNQNPLYLRMPKIEKRKK